MKTTMLALVSRLAREHTTVEAIERAARAELVSGAAQLIGIFRDAPRSEFRELYACPPSPRAKGATT